MKNTTLFIVLVVFTIAIGYGSKTLLDTDTLLLNSLAEQLTQEQLEQTLNQQSKWLWVGYAIIPILLLLKISLIAAIIDAGCFFFDKTIKYKTVFNMVVKAEFVFLLVIVFKTVWFYVFQQDYGLNDLQNFYPLSALNITGYNGLETWFIYPFQVLNLFEIAYWFILAYLLGKKLHIKTEKSLNIIASSYGVSLVIWVVGVMFLTLNMS
ncbi:hypothetical protein [Pontimicrobium sp. MEBiC06410]